MMARQHIPHMSRRDFEFLAEIIYAIPDTSYLPVGGDFYPAPTDNEIREAFAEHFADSLRFTNGNFNRKRFIKACRG